MRLPNPKTKPLGLLKMVAGDLPGQIVKAQNDHDKAKEKRLTQYLKIVKAEIQRRADGKAN